jgi:hypothetical protein
VVSDAVVVAGCLHSPRPTPPAAVSSLNSGAYIKAPESPDLLTVRETHLAKNALKMRELNRFAVIVFAAAS